MRDRLRDLWRRELPDLSIRIQEEGPPYPSLAAGEADAVAAAAEVRPGELPAGVTGFVLPRSLWGDGDPPAMLFRADDARMRRLRRATLPPVILAGAGPGGLGNLTRDASAALERADVVLHDELCGEEVLEAAGPGARLVPVGKRCGRASVPQDRINERLLEEALAGRRVVRLKTGDPAVYGRLAEEVTILEEAGLCYRVLGGISAAPAAAAWLGRPLTERGVASEIVFSTGRFAGGRSNRWPYREGTPPSLALYMSRKVLGERMAALMDAGSAPETPAVVVEKIGSEDMRAVHGTVGTIAAAADEAGVGTPAVVLVGGSFRPPDHLPLHGKRIWLTGEAGTAEEQRQRFEELGAVCVPWPLIETVELPYDGSFIENGRRDPFDWVAFTSPKSVDYLIGALRSHGHDLRWIKGRIAVLGERTEALVRERGLIPDLIPPEPYRRSLIEAMSREGLEGRRVLLPCSAAAPDEVRQALSPVAREVVRVDLYGLRYPEVREVPEVDVVVFTSPSTVASARENGLVTGIRERGMTVGGIGPVTARALREAGLRQEIAPTGYGPDNLARATVYRFAFPPARSPARAPDGGPRSQSR